MHLMNDPLCRVSVALPSAQMVRQALAGAGGSEGAERMYGRVLAAGCWRPGYRILQVWPDGSADVTVRGADITVRGADIIVRGRTSRCVGQTSRADVTVRGADVTVRGADVTG